MGGAQGVYPGTGRSHTEGLGLPHTRLHTHHAFTHTHGVYTSTAGARVGSNSRGTFIILKGNKII